MWNLKPKPHTQSRARCHVEQTTSGRLQGYQRDRKALILPIIYDYVANYSHVKLGVHHIMALFWEA